MDENGIFPDPAISGTVADKNVDRNLSSFTCAGSRKTYRVCDRDALSLRRVISIRRLIARVSQHLPPLGFARLMFPLVALALVTACFKPSVKDGGFLCGANNACPSGFSCASKICWRVGTDASFPVDRTDGARADANADLAGDKGSVTPDATADVPPVCVTPVQGCTPQAGTCDPVCQTSCGCTEKCTTNRDGSNACLALLGQRQPGQTCTVNSYGSASQNDDCRPGSVCLRPGGDGSGTSYCFLLCRNDNDCSGVPCVQRPVAPTNGISIPVAKVCDVAFVKCNPLKSYPDNQCPADRQSCYLATPDPQTGASRTTCEYAPGGIGRPDACTYSRDCFEKLVCPQAVTGAGFCSQICEIANPSCSAGTCRPYGSTYGYCF